jgi:ribonuclease P protein component
MASKICNLAKNKEIKFVFKQGRASYDKIIGVRAVFNNKDRNRATIIVGLKVSKKAVERNKIKRRLKYIIWPILNKKTKNNHDIIIIALPPIKDKKFKDMKESVTSLFKKLRIA